MYSYVLTKDAEDDLERIHDYGVAKFGMLQADKYYEMFFQSFDKIASNPFMFPNSDYLMKGYRYCVCGVDTIFYRIISDDMVEIVTIVGRQEY
ncbi:type II toxin-antitoxin system RelE/ParE family toxin [Flavobacterium hibisci]|uniref:type II toxin-antitoxin system RelE/ParE family toxin n=1 Tax=Flavobacterium hibisci TaxID=1914462 RepID=UPI001CC172B6|nr:type II toxin-antitoxin system RelE/ParE family toxin [Flavobacterium hibisci]MBZ4042257.1 type II toxin-antitoxin system RelE/ParE family toxin [Flavobacterium hibisci]